MNDTIIGTCSLCGGPVVIPVVWFGTIAPTPRCQQCGAVRAGGYGPTIPMRPIGWGGGPTTWMAEEWA